MLTRRCLFGLGLCLALTSCSAVAAAGFNDDQVSRRSSCCDHTSSLEELDIRLPLTHTW